MPAVPPPLRAHPAADPLTGPEDALSVILAAASQPPRREAVCLLLDHAHRGLGCIVVVGDGPITLVAELLEHLVASEGAISALVLASMRPGPPGGGPAGPSPTRGDLLVFHDLRERFDELAVDLVDWFVVTGSRASSLAELTDSQIRWRPRT